jgi:hypothetical protein
MATDDTCCTLVPYFKVHDGKLADFKALCERFVAKTGEEEKCLFYGFSFDGDQAHCREGYRDAAGILAHLENVGPLLDEALTTPASKSTAPRRSWRSCANRWRP